MAANSLIDMLIPGRAAKIAAGWGVGLTTGVYTLNPDWTVVAPLLSNADKFLLRLLATALVAIGSLVTVLILVIQEFHEQLDALRAEQTLKPLLDRMEHITLENQKIIEEAGILKRNQD